jgi:CDP-diacylglycerol---serine O-phosphatidyltransferase
MTLKDRFIDPHSPERRPRRAAYILPTLFTSGNIFLGYLATLQAFEGAIQPNGGSLGWNTHFEAAAKMIGVAVVLDGLDGRIARLTNTVSDFGRELDSLADVISFGIAPAVLAYAWGIHFLDTPAFGKMTLVHLHNAGFFAGFLFLVCGAMRLARFNITTHAVPKNPGRADRKYFVGLPIPAGAGMVAAVVYAADCTPIRGWGFGVLWLALLAMLALLMVSMWRYPSFKDINLVRPRSPITVVLIGCFFYLIWAASQPVLVAIATAYVGSGIAIRLGGILRRLFRRPNAPPRPEHNVG